MVAFGWISLSAMSVLLSLETEEPRLPQQRRMDIFRQQLLTCLLALYSRHLAGETATFNLTE